MARFNEILVGRFNRFLQKFFSMKGGPPSAQLATEVSSQIQLADADFIENRFVAAVNSWAFQANVAAGGAGNRSAIRLRNPTNSGLVVTVEKIAFAMITADQPFVTRGPLQAPDLTTTLAALPRDSRLQTSGSSTIPSFSSAAVITGATIWIGAGVTNSMAEVIIDPHHEVVLMPQDIITLYAGVQNQTLNAQIWWRERPLEEGEFK